ncbi:MAG: alkene reductase [Clostridia bacterium]|nr:alkene reductase [Deltaproteobacteria bacterium]
MSKLHSSYRLGALELKNRIVMAPMTRSRSTGNIPSELVATYYGQRAAAGLIITEGTAPSPNGVGYPRIPGLFSEAHVAGWKLTTKAVHDAGGHIVVQLMHTGRVGHPENLPKGARIVAPSAIAAPGQMYTDTKGPQDHPVPSAMTEQEITQAIAEHVTSAKMAIAAGFDGVELHGANGYLIEQFLNVASNKRADTWGGSVENRIRFAVEVARAVASAVGPERLGIRLSPYGVFNGSTSDPQTDEVYLTLTERLSAMKLAYFHTVDHTSMGSPPPSYALYDRMRAAFKGTRILSGGYDGKRAEADLVEGKGDLVAFGRPFMANPHLVEKLRAGKTLREPDMATAYTPGPAGYTDYPLD